MTEFYPDLNEEFKKLYNLHRKLYVRQLEIDQGQYNIPVEDRATEAGYQGLDEEYLEKDLNKILAYVWTARHEIVKNIKAQFDKENPDRMDLTEPK